jgi:hypothetical protein
MSQPSEEQVRLTIGKLDAARRQLRTAITLWFNDGDPVAVHTLASAAYEIIHAVSLKRNPGRRDLLWDSLVIKDEYRKEANALLRSPANFFKHADRDGDSVISFNPKVSESFFMFSLLGIHLCGEQWNTVESAWWMWIHIHKPHLLTEQGRKFVADKIPVESVNLARELPKAEFFGGFCEATHMIAVGKAPPGRVPTRNPYTFNFPD